MGTRRRRPPTLSVRPLRPTETEICLVARRMRQTLREVLADEESAPNYSLDWLERRVRWHLDSKITADVFVAEDRERHITGHAIVRVDRDEMANRIGLFSTIYVDPGSRRRGVANGLLEQGERWMRDRQLPEAVTYTHEENAKLHRLFFARGYSLSPGPGGFVKLSKPLSPPRETPCPLEPVVASPWEYVLFRQSDGTLWLFVACQSDELVNDLDEGIVRIPADRATELRRSDPNWVSALAADVTRDPRKYLDRAAAAEFHRLRN